MALGWGCANGRVTIGLICCSNVVFSILLRCTCQIAQLTECNGPMSVCVPHHLQAFQFRFGRNRRLHWHCHATIPFAKNLESHINQNNNMPILFFLVGWPKTMQFSSNKAQDKMKVVESCYSAKYLLCPRLNDYWSFRGGQPKKTFSFDHWISK